MEDIKSYLTGERPYTVLPIVKQIDSSFVELPDMLGVVGFSTYIEIQDVLSQIRDKFPYQCCPALFASTATGSVLELVPSLRAIWLRDHPAKLDLDHETEFEYGGVYFDGILIL